MSRQYLKKSTLHMLRWAHDNRGIKDKDLPDLLDKGLVEYFYAIGWMEDYRLTLETEVIKAEIKKDDKEEELKLDSGAVQFLKRCFNEGV